MTQNLDAGILEVIKNYEEKTEKFEGNPSKLVSDGIELMKSNEMDLAIFPLKKAVRLNANYRDAFLYLGYYYLKIGDGNEAIANLGKAEELDPIYPLTYKMLAESYKKTKDGEKSLAAKNKYEMLIK